MNKTIMACIALSFATVTAPCQAHTSELDKSKAIARHWNVVNNECRGTGQLGACAERDKLDTILEKRGCVYIGYDAPIGKRDRYRCAE